MLSSWKNKLQPIVIKKMTIHKIQFEGTVDWVIINLLNGAQVVLNHEGWDVDFRTESNGARLLLSESTIAVEFNSSSNPNKFNLGLFVEVGSNQQQIDLDIETSHSFQISSDAAQITTANNFDKVSLGLSNGFIIIEDTVWYRHPAQASPPNGKLKAGTRVTVLNPAGSYTRIRTDDGSVTGYVSSNVLAPIAVNPGDDQEAFDELTHQGIVELTSCDKNPQPWTNKPWRTAESLKQLLAQVNTLAPNRSKVSDGTIGDISHQNRTSDHNPHVLGSDGKGIVTAMDITHDPQKRCDCNILASTLETNRDPRVKYVIWNKKIMNSAAIGGADPWTWRPYTGANPHDRHIHISVKCDPANYDSRTVWAISVANAFESTDIIAD
ncbi:SH3 domain-containing protein [Telluribacter humicola]|uniref:hypothetical protein n=1 Tax=Telluribacter humicola TaxID=1720261 RepID=UPI001A968F13|nr:hypothetical protein [Telluribacter humicola]